MENHLDSILSMYLFETNSLLEQLDSILLKAESNKSFDKECIDEIFRIMHTIKGSSAMMQYESIMSISHKIEDLFYFIRENGIDPKYNEDLVNLVFKFSDFIKGEIVKVEEGKELETDLEEFEREIKDFLTTIKGKTTETQSDVEDMAKEMALSETSKETSQSGKNKYAVKIMFDDEASMENVRAFIIVNQLKETGIEFSYKPENIENIPETAEEISKNGFFIYINKEALNSAIEVVSKALNVKNYTILEYLDKTHNEDNSAIGSNKALNFNEAHQEKTINTKQGKQSLITVNLSKLDKLVDIVGELVIAESMVESNVDIKELNSDSFKKSTRQMRKLTDELQDIVMSLRMVPISGTFNKMQRIVRDMGKELNKEVNLVLSGEDTEIDKTIADSISDPIMHLVRNAMDHGIEGSEEERIKAGKSKNGTIALSAFNTGGEIHITVEDDGQGFNSEKILEKASAKGLLTKPESEYTQKEAFQLLMIPGFSTNENITEYSGRGVGMDVVKSNVEKVGGSVVLESTEGLGSKITFKIPLTLTIVSGMQVVVGNSVFIIPIKNIQQSFRAREDDIIQNPEHGEMIIIREKCYPILRISDHLNIDTQVENIEDGILVIVESGDNSTCLFVDKIIGEQQVVVKPLPLLLNKYNLKESGIYGCSILGDGSINLILDIGNLIESM